MIISEKRNGQQFFKPITDTPNVIELSYYANSLVSHFVLDAIIISTAQKLAQKHEKKYPNTVSRSARRSVQHFLNTINVLFANLFTIFGCAQRNSKCPNVNCSNRVKNTVIY